MPPKVRATPDEVRLQFEKDGREMQNKQSLRRSRNRGNGSNADLSLRGKQRG